MEIHYPSNRTITLCSVECFDESSCLYRGDVFSSDGSFGYDAIASIYFNDRDAILASTSQVIDAFLTEV